jgi:hypothetical protein
MKNENVFGARIQRKGGKHLGAVSHTTTVDNRNGAKKSRQMKRRAKK